MENGIIPYFNEQFNINIPPKSTREQFTGLLAIRINYLILHDFTTLIHILYRVDVSEQKLKKLLQENVTTDAGIMIAELVIERQLQKIRSRQMFRRDDTNIYGDEEAW